jgi:hypothetical protein
MYKTVVDVELIVDTDAENSFSNACVILAFEREGMNHHRNSGIP